MIQHKLNILLTLQTGLLLLLTELFQIFHTTLGTQNIDVLKGRQSNQHHSLPEEAAPGKQIGQNNNQNDRNNDNNDNNDNNN